MDRNRWIRKWEITNQKARLSSMPPGDTQVIARDDRPKFKK
jgi:hypothetical protein